MGQPAFASPSHVFVNRGFVNGGFRFGHNPRFHVFFGNPFFVRRRFFFPQPIFFPVVYGGGYSYPMVIQTGPSADSYRSDYEDRREMAREIERLSDQVERLREEQAARAEAARPQSRPQAEVESRPATVLVFKDQHIQEVRNYAIIGQTLWVFSEQHAKKIPLAQLDLPATTKLNDERGVEFRLPK